MTSERVIPECAIRVDGVRKKYRLFSSATHRLKEAFHPFRKRYHRDFWALDGITFDVPRGQTVGILGRNGSGKSTLLQVIAGVFVPNEGRMEVNGRVAALLELGAGFNPEFTGRENALLTGRMMGATRAEMNSWMKEIEAFADIGQFFDQPVKTYSSGMNARLGFATAINVDPDILIVDEALAVGDVRFQHKCFVKFAEFQKRKKTILFVTHSIDAVVAHCDRAILLDSGRILVDGLPQKVIDCYLELMFTGRLDSYSSSPNLLEEVCAGFNIFHFRKEYFAVAQLLGCFDLSQASEEILEECKSRGLIRVASSLEELRADVAYTDKTANSSLIDAPVQSVSVRCIDESDEVNAFLAKTVVKDHCAERKSFNPSAYRYGDGRGEILDYLLVADGVIEPQIVESGAKCVIYMKVRYLSDIQSPMFGLAIKTVDGQTVHGTNTMMVGTLLSPVIRGQTVTVKLEWEAALNAGDYFIDLGCAEVNHGESVPLDRRYGIVHMTIGTRTNFSGPADLRASISEVHRTSR